MREDLRYCPMSEGEAMMMLAWREPKACRTPWPISFEAQRRWHAALDPRESLWFAIHEPALSGTKHVGCVALQHIDTINGRAEISLVVDSELRGKGIGVASVEFISGTAFLRLRLTSIWGECYQCSGAVPFWEKVVAGRSPYSHSAKIPATKFYDGRLSWSYFFTLMRPGELPDVPTEEPMHSLTGVV